MKKISWAIENDLARKDQEEPPPALISWRKAAYHYRQILYMAVNRNDANLDPGDAPQLTAADALLCRMREMKGMSPPLRTLRDLKVHPPPQ